MDKSVDAGAILLDIEGTTTSISFVKDSLFPYVRTNLYQYLEENWSLPEVQDIVSVLRTQYEEDLKNGIPNVPEILDGSKAESINSIVNNVLRQMDEDRKTAGLKQLQGKIYRSGFEDGQIQAHVFNDVPGALKRWDENSKKVYIYSSGSIDAQKLLFQYTIYGNLSNYITGYFDTTTGLKLDCKSYKIIAANIGEPPHNILFLTDSTKEADAANEAGLHVVLLMRPGNADTDIDFTKYNTATDFSDFK